MLRCPWSGVACGCKEAGHGWPYPQNGKMPVRCQEAAQTARRGKKKAKSKTSPQRTAMKAASLGKPCPYCALPMGLDPWALPTLDHIVPRAVGGSNNIASGNIIVVCYRCNQDKEMMTLTAWQKTLARVGDPRASTVAAFVAATVTQSADAA